MERKPRQKTEKKPGDQFATLLKRRAGAMRLDAGNRDLANRDWQAVKEAEKEVEEDKAE